MLQLNKRALPNGLPVDVLAKELCRKDEPVMEAVAYKGVGIFETLKEVSSSVLNEFKNG